MQDLVIEAAAGGLFDVSGFYNAASPINNKTFALFLLFLVNVTYGKHACRARSCTGIGFPSSLAPHQEPWAQNPAIGVPTLGAQLALNCCCNCSWHPRAVLAIDMLHHRVHYEGCGIYGIYYINKDSKALAFGQMYSSLHIHMLHNKIAFIIRSLVFPKNHTNSSLLVCTVP